MKGHAYRVLLSSCMILLLWFLKNANFHTEQIETEKDFVLASIEDKDNENDINNRTDITRKRKTGRKGVNYLHGR